MKNKHRIKQCLSLLLAGGIALYRNLGTEQQRGFLSDVNTVGGGLLRSLSRTLAVQTREPPAAEYAVAVPPAKKQSRQRERG